jgi:uncharacterized paraquat-inducible protein A
LVALIVISASMLVAVAAIVGLVALLSRSKRRPRPNSDL